MGIPSAMKHLRIDPAVNGWIVSRQDHYSTTIEPTYVFNNVKDLQDALPALLSGKPLGPFIDASNPDLIREPETT